MQAKITVTADVNILALNRMLVENGRWLVTVHNRQIVKAVQVPPDVSVDRLVGEEGPTTVLPENHSDNG